MFWVSKQWHVIRGGIVGSLIAGAIILLYVSSIQTPDDVLTVVFFDVGQGDALFIEAPNGRQILIDGGPSRAVVRELGRYMPFWDRSIDVVIATHPDRDHINGLIDVMNMYEVGAIAYSGVVRDTDLYSRWRAQIQRHDGVSMALRAGHRIELSPSVYFEVLFPLPELNVARMEPNHGSIIGRLVYGETAFLLSGDAPKEIEAYVSTQHTTRLASDVVKVGHHGSNTSTALPWIGWSDPDYAVISAGRDNPYGHPDQSVVDRLRRFHVEILQTAKDGSIVFESDGEQVRRIE